LRRQFDLNEERRQAGENNFRFLLTVRGGDATMTAVDTSFLASPIPTRAPPEVIPVI
jgi:hypothetical protein